MHAPLAGRLTAALTEVQAFVGESIAKLQRRARRAPRFDRRPPAPETETEHDPVLALLAAAPLDDEPVTDDDRRHLDEGRRAFREGRVVSSEDVRRGCLGARGETDRVETDPTASA